MPFDIPQTDTPAANRREIFARLCSELPPSVADTPDLRAKRDEDAMDAVAALHPDDAFEALLAVRIVAMDAHAGDSLRSAGLAVNDPMEVRRCRAQAASMARQADAALRSLLRIQAIREKQLAEKHPAAMERAGYWFKEIVLPDPAPPPPAAARSDAEPERTEADIDAEAELYVVMYPDRAERIRAAGGLPARLDFGAPGPEIVARLLKAKRLNGKFPMPRDTVA
jgi:hypothetical protein